MAAGTAEGTALVAGRCGRERRVWCGRCGVGYVQCWVVRALRWLVRCGLCAVLGGAGSEAAWPLGGRVGLGRAARRPGSKYLCASMQFIIDFPFSARRGRPPSRRRHARPGLAARRPHACTLVDGRRDRWRGGLGPGKQGGGRAPLGLAAHRPHASTVGQKSSSSCKLCASTWLRCLTYPMRRRWGRWPSPRDGAAQHARAVGLAARRQRLGRPVRQAGRGRSVWAAEWPGESAGCEAARARPV
jgi:hypothetical protein